MPRAQIQPFEVFVYRPNGWLLTKTTEFCTRADVAKKPR